MTFSTSTSTQPTPQALQQLRALLALSAPTTALTYIEPNVCPRTPLLKEERADTFRYWQDGRLHTGLTFSGDLFYAVVEFDLHSYLEGIRVADDLRNSGILSVITASDQTLTVWVSMRSQAVLSDRNADEPPAEQNHESSVD
ncbi:MAG: hypothetical protein ACTS2F_09945 [Thainema sp.]